MKWRDTVHGCMVYTERAEMAAVSSGTSHVTTKQQCSYTTWVNIQSEARYWAVQWRWFARVNALCSLSRKRSREVAESLPGRFLSRRCFRLCITMEDEPRIAKQYKCHHCCSYQNYRRKGMEVGKKVSLRRFFRLTRRSRVRGKKKRFGASYSTINRFITCCQTHSDYGPPKISS